MRIISLFFLFLGANTSWAQTASSSSVVEFDALLAEPNEFPWMARLVSYFVKNDTSTHFRGPCAGTLIARQWVLTTARCVMAQPGNQVADGARIRLGKYDLKNATEAGEEFLLAREFYVHPDYNPSISMSDKDFALIKLPRPVTVTLQVQPIQLPNRTTVCQPNFRDIDETVDQCMAGMTVGWSRASPLETQAKRRLLRMMKLDVQPFRACKQKLIISDNSSRIIDATTFTRGKLCAGGIDRQHACFVANPGAPFMCRVAANRDRVLVGVFLDDVQDSANLTFDPLTGCERASRARPSIFGRVCSILDWIDSFNMTDMGSTQLVYRPGDYPVRLTGDPAGNGTRGYVEFYYNNTWGTVCDDSFTATSARVVCRQLGLPDIFARTDDRKLGLSKPSTARPIWLDDVVCNGFERNLAVCQHQPYGTNNCGHSEDVVIQCLSSVVTAPTYVYNPQSGQIVDGTFRLVGGGARNDTGFLEVWYSGQWGTVCDDLFSQNSASVACRHLGFGEVRGEVIANTEGIQRSGATQIWLDDVACTGTEQSLLACEHSNWGVNNCGHSEDVAIRCSNETWVAMINPSNATIGEIRLTGGRSNSSGIVEVFINGLWGTVCDDSFNTDSARVACRMLGFSENNARVLNSNANFRASTQSKIWLDDVLCRGMETTLLQCAHRTLGENNCDHSEDVAVSCEEPSGMNNAPSEPGSYGQLRLVGSNNNYSGIIEVYYGNQWGTVCDDGFNQAAAGVVCRQLGFDSSRAAILLNTMFNASLAFQIWLDDIVCQGTEVAIAQCRHNGWGEENCGHSEDVAITCERAVAPVALNDSGSNGQVRLVGSSSVNASSGFVEIYWTSTSAQGWGTVCDDGFGIASARVVCRQLGFNPEYAQLLFSTIHLFRSTSPAIWLDDVNCLGSEQTLADCPHSPWGTHNCARSEDIAISCLPTDSNRASDIYTVGTTTPEGPMEPGTPGEVRLSGAGGKAAIGFVEFYWNGRWGTVCDDGFTISAAQVVCRQLNLSPAFAQIGSSTGLVPSRYRQIWLDNVACSGVETSLGQCTHNGYGVHNCDSSENVVVSCSAELWQVSTTTTSSYTGPTQPASMASQSGYEGQVRLTGSTEPATGFVEIYWLGRWGSVCDDGFTVTSAQVVCRQLGYADISRAIVLPSMNGLARSAASTMWLDDVACLGLETTLSSCPHREWGGHNCNFDTENVAITCMGRVAVTSTASTPSFNRFTPNADSNAQLIVAVKTNQIELVDSLLRRGASPNVVSPTCCTHIDASVLTCAACAGYFQIASLLVANGADLETRDSGSAGTALIWAAKAGFWDIVRLLVISGAEVDARTTMYNDTALMFAANAGNFEVVRYLIDSGADLTLRQSRGMTAAQLARSNGFNDIANYLEGLLHATGQNADGSQTTNHMMTIENLNLRMFSAIAAGFSDQVDTLLKQGASSRARTTMCCSTYENATALICAACSGFLRTCQILVDKNADINEPARMGFTPLMAASRSGGVVIVKYLLRKGAVVNARTTSMETPLMWAASNGNFDTVVSLVEAGADIELVNSMGSNATTLARSNGHSTIVTYLTEQKVLKTMRGR